MYPYHAPAYFGNIEHRPYDYGQHHQLQPVLPLLPPPPLPPPPPLQQVQQVQPLQPYQPYPKPRPVPRRRGQQPSRSFVGVSGYPSPAQRCQEKAPFSADEDDKIKMLKEMTDPPLSWRQIGEFFPGRTFNTLQVHYCTKLKGNDVVWTSDMDKQLRVAVQQDRANRGKRVAKALGGVFTAEECEQRRKLLLQMDGSRLRAGAAGQAVDGEKSTSSEESELSRKRPDNGDASGPTSVHPSPKRPCMEPQPRHGPSYRGKKGQPHPSAFWDTV